MKAGSLLYRRRVMWKDSDSPEKSFIIFLNPLSLSYHLLITSAGEDEKRGLGGSGVSRAQPLPGRRWGKGRKLESSVLPTITSRRALTEDQRLEYMIIKRKKSLSVLTLWKESSRSGLFVSGCWGTEFTPPPCLAWAECKRDPERISGWGYGFIHSWTLLDGGTLV